MPRGDRTGPYGDGPITGRRMGFCTGNSHSCYENNFAGYRRGFGNRHNYNLGQGYGRGLGYGFSNVSEKTLLENEMRVLKDQLTVLENRLSNINKESNKKD